MKNIFKKHILVALTFSTIFGMATSSFASDQLLCSNKETAVYDDSLELVLFLGESFEGIKMFQGWTENRKEVEMGGKTISFVKVQFTDRDEEDGEVSEGWVPFSLVKNKATCPSYIEQEIKEEEPEEVAPIVNDIAGLKDPNCCRFPLATSAKASFLSGQRRFGAARSKGKRKHAACDLYHRNQEPVLAVAPGKIIRSRYYFYQGTYAVEVQHSGGFIVRYGELSDKQSAKTKGKINIAAGDEIGFIKKVNSNCCEPMLHFELYSGKGKGPLSIKASRGFQRRSDLLNPSKYLQAWEGRK